MRNDRGYRRLRMGAAVGSVVIAVDQLAKALCNDARGGASTGATMPVRNPGMLTGLGGGSGMLTVLIVMAVFAGIGCLLVHRVRTGRVPAWAAGLLFGGAASNLADRIAVGSVRDFLVVGRLVINVADVAVLTGVVAYVAAGARRNLGGAPSRRIRAHTG
jgi:lipoprotein signal peptidase